MKESKKYYKIKYVVLIMQITTMILISISAIEISLKIMLLFAYFMLFRQERWHKHLLIMLVMISILFASSQLMLKSISTGI